MRSRQGDHEKKTNAGREGGSHRQSNRELARLRAADQTP